MVEGFEPVPRRRVKDAQWVAEALRRGAWGEVAGVVPGGFPAYAAVLHPAWRCVCTAGNVAAFHSGHETGDDGEETCQPIAWSAVADSGLPVVYGHWETEEYGVPTSRPTQYRRLPDGRWIVDKLDPGSSDIVPLIRPGDAWISGPTEGTLPRPEAQALAKLLRPWTLTPGSCWFGIWEGFGWLEGADLRAAAIEAPGRRWHLFRAPLAHLPRSFDPQFEEQTANLVWPDDRSWCLATEIDSEVTYIGGSEELVASILAAPGLETRATSPEARLLGFHSLLQPVAEMPADSVPGPGFQARESQFGRSPEHEEHMRDWVAEQERAWRREWRQPLLIRGLRRLWRWMRGRRGRATVYVVREED